jgi:short subunit dehydrogenase-like uncharacterized protein
VRALTGLPGYDRAVGKWVLPFASLDPQVVTHSARALPEYGPDFSYSHYIALSNPVTAAGIAVGVGGLVALAQLPPARTALQRLRPSGSGPSAEQREKGWFSVRFVGTAADGTTVRTEVRGGDPGYGETSKMLAESALCLALDDLPSTAGSVTTATAMGPALRKRLAANGISFTLR